jgi:hypothetical protein
MQTVMERTGVSDKAGRYAAFILLDLTFVMIVVTLAHTRQVLALSPFTFGELSLATLRLAHAVSYNAIFEWLRAPFTRVIKDSCGAGMNVEPAHTGAAGVLGELLSCPLCSGTWAALALVFMLVVFPTVGNLLLHILAAAGACEVLHRLVEHLEWSGRQARVVSGAIAPDKE